ncbi:1,3-beta-glucanosyltransferase gas1 [Podila minutissima]|uniref:Multifunctional fusion protein n=1 Tax=Podila minutissima TaxID=64525 RepID=A0A9P5VL32_9FUNG|nr:1,3-beta-glucanosyltransferase gas1 [Podila minutissima]
MKKLGLNTVRVYQVDMNLNHDGCMNILEEHDMYLLQDLASTLHSIIRTTPEYNTNFWNGVRTMVDAFNGYSNTLAIFAGNEVANDKNTTDASSYVKVLVRNTKAYIASSAPRRFPVGYANNDNRLQVQSYFDYGPEAERIDFFGINLYECNYGLVQINKDNTVQILVDYNNIKAVLADVHPVSVTMDAFADQRPASTSPAITPAWQASTLLPPTPSSSTCECMMSSLSCVASVQVSLRDLLNTACGMTSCEDIGGNGKTSVYGKYTFCSPAQRLSYIYNSYCTTVGQKSVHSCNFDGMVNLSVAGTSSNQGCGAIAGISASAQETTSTSSDTGLSHERPMFDLLLAVDLLNPSHALEQKTHKLKRLVQSPNSYFMDVKCPGCVQITTVFSHAQTVVMCSSCANVLAQPTGGITRLTEGCSFRRKQA